MYINNKYKTWYFNIVEQARTRKLNSYTEKHHILPLSLGGTNNSSNIVRLTAREHFICHKLLVKMVSGQAKYKMLEAVAIFSNNRIRKLHVNSRDIEVIRKANAEASALRNKGNQHYKNRKPDSPKLLALRSKNAAKSRWVNDGLEERFTKDFEQFVARGYTYGRLPFSDNARKNMGISSKAAFTTERRDEVSKRFKGKPKSEETKQRMRKPKPDNTNYQGRSWYHSKQLGLEACVREQPQWSDAEKGRLPKPPKSVK